MSVDHKRPLFAFVIVAIACAVIIANGIRSEAFVAMMRTGASHIVAGMVLEPARHRPQHTTAAAPGPTHVDRSSATSAPPAPVVSRHPVVSRSGGRHAAVTAGHRASGHHASGHHASGHERSHHDGAQHGRDHDPQHEQREQQGRSHGRGHEQHGRSHDQGRGYGYGHGYQGDGDRQRGHRDSAGRAHEGHDRRH